MNLKAIVTTIQNVIIEYYLIFAVAIALIWGLAFPYPGAYLRQFEIADRCIIQFINVCIVFFISGLTLKVEELKDIWKHKYIILYGFLVINFFTTLLAPLFLSFAFIKKEFRLGLAIFSTVPTTLGVGVSLTQQCKGDTLLALFLTVMTNLVGSVTTPFLLLFYFDVLSNNPSTFNPVGLLIDLILSVLVPSLMGIAVRVQFSSTMKEFTKTYKTYVSMFSNTNLVCIMWIAISKSQPNIVQQSAGDIFIVIAVVIIQHFFYLLVNFTLTTNSHLLNFPVKQAVTVTIMASQKSNPVALAVIAGMGLSSNTSGLMIIPGLLGQVSQIFIVLAYTNYFQKLCQPAKPKDTEESEKISSAVSSSRNLITHEYEPVDQTTADGEIAVVVDDDYAIEDQYIENTMEMIPLETVNNVQKI
jgi:sodium/bile acid cotransporter 7